jgi:5'(3')-deoxyribonucleotidase
VELKRKTIAVDLDGVCADYYRGLRPIAAKWLDVPIQQLPTTVSIGLKEWGVDRRPGGFEALHRYALEKHQLFLRLDPIPGAAQGLRWLSRNCDAAVRIVTNRLVIKNLAYLAVLQTTEWLNVHEIPYDEMCFVDDKRTVSADVYIEDNPMNIRRLRDAGKAVIAFRSAITGDMEPPLVSAWADLSQVVRSLQMTAPRLDAQSQRPADWSASLPNKQ